MKTIDFKSMLIGFLVKFLYPLIILFAFSFGQLGKDFKDMSQTEKMMMYNSHKKNPSLGIFLAMSFPTLGHSYSENWIRGVKIFFGGTLLVTSIGYLIDKEEGADVGSLLGLAFGHICQIADANRQVDKYNKRIYKEIFGKEPPSFSLNLQPTYQGANLNLSYSFK